MASGFRAVPKFMLFTRVDRWRARAVLNAYGRPDFCGTSRGIERVAHHECFHRVECPTPAGSHVHGRPNTDIRRQDGDAHKRSIRSTDYVLQRSLKGQVLAFCSVARRFSTVKETGDSEKTGSGPVVAVGMSGGVDSSVAALLLKRQGYRVFGVYMRNWDTSDEAGNVACSAEQDYEDAQRVCKQLGIELFEVDNQRRYWVDVFESFTRDCGLGLTPNPDLACNQHIKFSALLEQAKQLGADRLATGHYARLQHSHEGTVTQLLRGIDHGKDQSYFLASVAGTALQKVMFPLGSLLKSDVRKLAVSENLSTAQKRSSAGICFVGRRNFADFISEYVEMKPGPFIAVNNGSVIGTHEGIPAYTHGQRARIGGKPEAWYVVGKDVPNNAVFVAGGPHHSALFSTSAVADSLSWISGREPEFLSEGRVLKCLYKARYRQPVEECTVALASAESEEACREGMGAAFANSKHFTPSTLCRLQFDAACGQHLQIRFNKPARAITPGQALVLYDGDICLGAGRLRYPGPSIFEEEFKVCDWEEVARNSTTMYKTKKL